MTMQAALANGPDTEDVLLRAQAGDEAAFEDLVLQHQAMVFGLALNFLRHRAEAEDLSQDVFVALHQNLARVESAAHLKYWLCRVTSRRCIDRVRRLSWRLEQAMDRLPDRPASQPGPGNLANPANPANPANHDPLLAAMLRRLVGELAPPARLVVTLRFQEDLQLSEIAEILEMPINTVKSHLHRSLETLRAKLADRGTFHES